MNEQALLAYFQSQPRFVTEYNRVKSTGDKRSPAQWMQGVFNENPEELQGYNQYAQANGIDQYADPGLGLASITNSINDAAQAGADRAGAGGNLSQVQVGQQEGEFSTTGNTNQTQTTEQTGTTSQDSNMSSNTSGTQETTGTQTGTQTGTTEQNTEGTSTQTGTSGQEQVGSTTGQTNTTGTTKTGVVDTLGLGDIVKNQAAGIGASDAARTAFLTDTMQNGGTGFRDQVAQATNRSLSGPGMQGVGNMAQGRAVGAAVGDVARNDQAARLNAANQLAGPTGAVTAANQTSAFLGAEGTQTGSANTTQQTQNLINGFSNLVNNTTGKTTGASTNTTDMTNTSNTANNSSTTGNQSQTGTSTNLGLSNLVGSETNAGTSSANSGQVATGQVPENTQTQSGGGCYVCTAYHSLGKPLSRSITDAVRFKLANFHTYGLSLLGYSVYGPYLARAVLGSKAFRTVFKPFAMAVLYEELRLAGRVRRKRVFATACHAVFDHAGAVFGGLVYLTGRKTIITTQLDVQQLLLRNNLYFHV
jgi:hypothetical protein